MGARAPLRRVPLGHAEIAIERRADGGLLLRSPRALEAYPDALTSRLAHWAQKTPDEAFIAQRDPGDPTGGWRVLRYGEALRRVRALAASLLERGLSAERPVAILSENGIEHALLALACMHVGIPYVPVSPAYSLLSADHGKLRYAMQLLTPGLVFASDRGSYEKAVAGAVPRETEVLYGESFRALEKQPDEAVDRAHSAVGPDTIAKFLLTSGSTGQPKAVINTQRMLCSNQQMLVQSLPWLAETRPVLVDWLPWNHTAGGNHNVGITLFHGGTLHIDEGRPVPGLIEKTVRNLRDIAPTIYFNVPRGYEALLPFLREDAALRKNFFSRLGLLQYAAAVLPQPIWQAYEELAAQACGERVLWITGYGATETAPFAMSTNQGAARAGTVGLPVDGVEMKLAPVEGKLEARFRGPNITPGYWRQHELTSAAYDDEGYYRTGDAMRFLDASNPKHGLEFDGRIAEDFKLGTGTWVSVGPLRARFIAACSPYVQDCVITGHDRNAVGALAFLNIAAAKDKSRDGIRATIAGAMALLARDGGSSMHPARVLILEEPPSIDAGEITDKGSINQRAVLARRAALVEMLYRDPPDAAVIVSAP